MVFRSLLEKPISKYLFEIGLQPGFIADLKKGNLVIPGNLVRVELEKAVATETGVALKACDFTPHGIHIELSLVRYGLRIRVPLNVKVSRALIDGDQQKIECVLVKHKSIGENVLGKIVCALADRMIARRLNEKISRISLVSESHFDQHNGRCVIDLGGLKQIEPLKKKIPIIGISVLDIFPVKHIVHVADGIRLG